MKIPIFAAALLAPLFLLTGCSTPKTTDTARSAVEQKLIATTIERSLSKADFTEFRGEKIFLDYNYLEPQVDKKYVQGILEMLMAECGITLVGKEEESAYVVQPLCGVLATDQHRFLLGSPPLPIPIPDTTISIVIPEIAVFSKFTRTAHARFSFNILKSKGREPYRTIQGINTSSQHTNWVILLIPFVSHNLITEELDPPPSQYFWQF